MTPFATKTKRYQPKSAGIGGCLARRLAFWVVLCVGQFAGTSGHSADVVTPPRAAPLQTGPHAAPAEGAKSTTGEMLPHFTIEPAPYDWRESHKWPLEQLRLKDGRVLAGVFQAESTERVDFLEVRRLPGQPTYLVRRRLPAESMAELTRLPPADRNALLEKIEKFRNRSLEELRNMRGLALVKHDHPSGHEWSYTLGPWFELHSQTDEELTRRAIVRIEQMFQAFAEILPPRRTPQQRLKIHLFGTLGQYQEFQAAYGIQLKNPAFFIPEKQLLAAGSELTELVRELNTIKAQHAKIQEQIQAHNASLKQRLREQAAEYQRIGYAKEEIAKLIGLQRSQWQKELNQLKGELKQAEAANTQVFEKATGEMFARLYHEAFHAYLANFVYPAENNQVPRWLNEGLAQVFERGIVEVGTLRLDLPEEAQRSALQRDLLQESRLPLEEVLGAEETHFLVRHGQSTDRLSERYYLYAWGLAYYLVIHEPVLESRQLDNYVAASSQSLSPRARFEALVGMPLEQFEVRWRAFMQADHP
ncbi:MAG: DUF1570 domain-containing protein [Pirellulales bacterium]|nr:DUF1570 domain-containing protein [Pirellulales bacterium]